MHAVIEEREGLQSDGKDTSTQVILNILHSFGYTLSLALTRLAQNKFYGKNDVNKAGQLLWPQGVHDLLPYGFEDSALGLDLWLREPEGHLVYTVAIAFMNFHVPFKASLIRPPDYTFALARPLQHLTANIERYRTTELDERGLEYYQSSIYATLKVLTSWQQDCAGAWRRMLYSPTGNALLKSSIPLLEELYDSIQHIPGTRTNPSQPPNYAGIRKWPLQQRRVFGSQRARSDRQQTRPQNLSRGVF